MNAKMTYHCQYERSDRVQHIIKEIGIGQVVKERYQVRYPHGDSCYHCITDTGVTLIKTEDRSKIITIYVTSYRELVTAYNGTKKIPPYLKKKVQHNEQLYIKNGKTIWA